MVLTASAALTAAVLPVFLIGAMTDLVREDLGVGEAAIGAAATSLFVVAALAATTIGRVTERLGAARSLRVGVLIAAVVAATIGGIPGGYLLLLGATAVAGLAVCFVDTGAALAFADHLPVDRQGTAFGIKEASIPGASLLAGVALPTIASTFGWRTVFLAALVIPVVLLVALPRHRAATASVAPSTPSTPRGPVGPAATSDLPNARDRTTVTFAIGVAFGTGAATAAATFLVPALTRAQLGAGAAGAVLAVASLASITVRLAVGRWADRPSARPARAVAGLLGLGSLGAVTLALAGPLPVAVAAGGAVLLLAAGWGWTGLAFLAVVRARPGAPAAAAGIVLTGLSAGGAAGPVAFGALADLGSYPLAWWVAAGALVLGGFTTARAAAALDVRV